MTTTTDRLMAEACQLLEEHRAMLDGDISLRTVTLVLSLRRDGIKSLFKPEYERER